MCVLLKIQIEVKWEIFYVPTYQFQLPSYVGFFGSENDQRTRTRARNTLFTTTLLTLALLFGETHVGLSL